MNVTLTLPAWIDEGTAQLPTFIPTLAERMAAVIRYAPIYNRSQC